MELFGEIALVFLAGSVLGIFGAAAVTPMLQTIGAGVTESISYNPYRILTPLPTTEPERAVFYPELIVPVLGLCLAAALICCGAGVAGLHEPEE